MNSAFLTFQLNTHTQYAHAYAAQRPRPLKLLNHWSREAAATGRDLRIVAAAGSKRERRGDLCDCELRGCRYLPPGTNGAQTLL